MDLSIVVPGDMKYNVELAHQFLYDAKLASVDNGTEATGEHEYSPSLTLQQINDAILNKTGVYKPEDPEFRGEF